VIRIAADDGADAEFVGQQCALRFYCGCRESR